MNEAVLETKGVGGRSFPPLGFTISPGEGLIVSSASSEALDELLETVFGLADFGNGEVRLGGRSLGRGSERMLLTDLEKIGYASERGGLIGNLKVWENLILPREGRGTPVSGPSIEQIEERVIEAFAAASIGEARAVGLMPRVPDQLSPFERTVCALVRCHLAGFGLLVCDRIFERLDEGRRRRLAALVDWLGERHQGSALFVLHHSIREAEDRFGLEAWNPIHNITLEVESWRAS